MNIQNLTQAEVSQNTNDIKSATEILHAVADIHRMKITNESRIELIQRQVERLYELRRGAPTGERHVEKSIEQIEGVLRNLKGLH